MDAVNEESKANLADALADKMAAQKQQNMVKSTFFRDTIRDREKLNIAIMKIVNNSPTSCVVNMIQIAFERAFHCGSNAPSTDVTRHFLIILQTCQ